MPTEEISPHSSTGQRPRRVRVWHFIVLPGLAMGAMLLLSRLIGLLLLDRLGPSALEVFSVSRTILISAVMASLIAWLAVAYRRQYEAALRVHNKALEETRDFLTNIIESSGEAIVTLDVEDRVSSWNRAAERMRREVLRHQSIVDAKVRKVLVHGDLVEDHLFFDVEVLVS